MHRGRPARAREGFGARLARGAASESYLVLLVAAAAILLLLGAGLFVTADTWLALVAGRVVAHSGPPSTDTLTAWTLGRDWIDQQWLGQLVLYELWRAGGLAFVALVHVATVVATFVWTIVAARRRTGTPRDVALVALLAVLPVGFVAGNIRTQTFALPLFVAVLVLLSHDSRAPSRRVLLTLPLLALWANVHGSVILGAGLVALAGGLHVLAALRSDGGSERILHGLALVAGAPIALLATPYGTSLFAYLGDLFGNAEIAELASDWMPTTLTAADAPFFLLAGLTLVLIGRDRQLTAFEQLALVLLLVGGMTAGRNVAWFALAALLVVPASLTRSHSGRAVSSPPVAPAATMALLAVIGVVVAGAQGLGRVDREVDARFPPALGAVLARTAAGDPSLELFTHPRYADWLLFRHPQLAGRIPFDIRYELLHEAELRRFRRFRDQIGADWRAAAGAARLFVLDSSEKPLEVLPATSTILLRERGAQQRYAGHDGVMIELP